MTHNTITVHLPAEHSLEVTSSDFGKTTITLLNGVQEADVINKSSTLRIGPFSKPRDYSLHSDTNGFTYMVEEEKLAYNHEGTGVFTGGQLTINAIDNTTFDLAAGRGVIVDNYTKPEEPKVIHVEWPAQIGITADFLATEFGTLVALDATGTVQQFPTSEPSIDKRDNIYLGVLGHSNNVAITSIGSTPMPGYDQTHMFIDMADSIGVINKEGNVYGPNGANLKVDKLAGQSFAVGHNKNNSDKSPNITSDPATSPTLFFIGIRDGAGGFATVGSSFDIPVGFYDNNTGTPVAVPASDPWQIFRIYFFPGINTNILIYGQNVYKNRAAAEASIFGEVYDEPAEVSAGGILRSYLIVKRDATDLTDTTTAKFVQANEFGKAAASGVSTATTTLQQAYANSDPIAEIVTNSLQAALTVKEGTNDNTALIYCGTDFADTEVYNVDGRGRIKGATHGDTTANRPATPLTYHFFFDTTLGKPIWYDGTNWVDATGAIV